MKISKKTVFIFLYPFLIFLFAILPINNNNGVVNHTYVLNIRLDHLFHALLFFPWMIFPTLLSARKIYAGIKLSTVTWFFGGLLIALATEGIQYFLNYRSFTFIDLLSNISGLFFGWLCLPALKAICNLLKINLDQA